MVILIKDKRAIILHSPKLSDSLHGRDLFLIFGIFWVTKVKFKGNTKITVMNECIFQNGEMLLYRKFNFGKSLIFLYSCIAEEA